MVFLDDFWVVFIKKLAGSRGEYIVKFLNVRLA